MNTLHTSQHKKKIGTLSKSVNSLGVCGWQKWIRCGFARICGFWFRFGFPVQFCYDARNCVLPCWIVV